MSEQTSSPVEVRIADLVQHRAFQVRRKLDGQRIRTYAAGFKVDGDIAQAPILVGRIRAPAKPRRGRPAKHLQGIDAGALVLLAGYHRVAACQSIGRDTILAQIVDTTAREAQWLAAESNLSHGLPLKPAEVREAFYAYIRAGQHRDGSGRLRSLREMGRKFGKHHETVRDWLNVKEFRAIHALYQEDPPKPARDKEVPPEVDPVEDTMLSIDEALRQARVLTAALNDEQRERLAASLRTTLEAIEGASEAVSDSGSAEGLGKIPGGFPYGGTGEWRNPPLQADTEGVSPF